MKTIYKYPLQLTNLQTVMLPTGAQVLHVGMQDDTINLWALVDTFNPLEAQEVWMVGTGRAMPFSPVGYLGTVFDDGYVWHVFLQPRTR